jgi:hypothetical protein
MTAVLLDCRLLASATGKNRPTVTARVLYDTASMGTAPAVTFELTLPEAGDPGVPKTVGRCSRTAVHPS